MKELFRLQELLFRLPLKRQTVHFPSVLFLSSPLIDMWPGWMRKHHRVEMYVVVSVV